MTHTSLILTALMTIALLVVIAPKILAFNGGHILRNIAIWLAIFFGLALIYQNFGPESPHPMFQFPDSFQRGTLRVIQAPEKQQNAPAAKEDDKEGDAKDTTYDGNEKDFSPPKE